MALYAEIIISISHENIDRVFHYVVPPRFESQLQAGMRVLVPFGMGNKKIDGYIIGFSRDSDIPGDKLKEIAAVPEGYPVFSETMITLAKWMKEKYYTTFSDCFKCILPSGLGTNGLSVNYAYLNPDWEGSTQDIRNPKQAEVLRLLAEAEKAGIQGVSVKEIKAKLKISDSPIQTLKKNRVILLRPFASYRNPINRNEYIQTQPFQLNREQQLAFDFLRQKLYDKESTVEQGFSAKNAKPVLLHGVTGSGKTEIYLQLIAEVLKLGKQAIVLVPEISLTPQTIRHFVGRFGERVSVTHSRLSNGERFDQWRKAKEGRISVMIGPRSAIFTPFDNLGMIIIDEEHEHTYKSETSPKYHVREVAQKLMEATGCMLLMGSATPGVETYYQAQKDEIELVELKRRVNKTMPQIHIIDMREELAQGNRSVFSRPLHDAIAANLENREQTILFLNRRGHSTFVSCRACGYVLACDQCSINYTYHAYSNRLICHYCGKEEDNPEFCPVCGSKHIKYFGVGTQKIEEEIGKVFPSARLLRMDMDTTSTKHSHERILSVFGSGEADILIGTQMIAKGHDFPNVSLVGILAADLSLNTGDFRSGETTFQLIAQVAGRAGRAAKQGEVFIQTYNPAHYSILCAKEHDYQTFYEHEIMIRKQMAYPPFTNIFSVLFTGEDEKKIILSLNKLAEIMRYYNKKGLFEMLGPAPAQISKINKNFRWKIFVKCKDEEKIKSFVFYCLKKLHQREDISGITVNATLNPLMLV